MRPYRASPTTESFPVYPDLVDILVNPAKDDGSNVVIRRVMATCSAYSYSDAKTLSMIMARMGLDKNDCLEISQSVDAMSIASTSFLVQSSDRRVVILSYRGTEPDDVINWLASADVNVDKIRIEVPGGGGAHDVHAGFYRNVRATRYKVLEALQCAENNQSVRTAEDPDPSNKELTGAKNSKPSSRNSAEPAKNPVEALYITGHSLGGAMAVLMAIMLHQSKDFQSLAGRLKGVYTFGQPMIGSPEFADACGQIPSLCDKVFRYVYRSDWVPQLPPKESGHFKHFGHEFQYRAGHWHRVHKEKSSTQTNIYGIGGAFVSFFSEKLLLFRGVPFSASLVDHFPQQYIAALTPPGETTEFGDSDAGVVVRSPGAPAVNPRPDLVKTAKGAIAMTFSAAKGVADEAGRVARIFVPWI